MLGWVLQTSISGWPKISLDKWSRNLSVRWGTTFPLLNMISKLKGSKAAEICISLKNCSKCWPGLLSKRRGHSSLEGERGFDTTAATDGASHSSDSRWNRQGYIHEMTRPKLVIVNANACNNHNTTNNNNKRERTVTKRHESLGFESLSVRLGSSV